MNIHYFQHVAFEGLGAIEGLLLNQGHTLTATHFYTDDYTVPDINSIDALIIMGGPMSVYDDHAYPWLHAEKAFIEDCIQQGKKVLGICLGAQLIAVCIGAHVYTATNKEIGWFPVFPTDECHTVPWFYNLFKNNLTVFHWHGDKFEIPYDDSICLLYSEANDNQAFMKGGSVIALQFHLEATAETVQQMIAHGEHELKQTRFIQSKEQLEEGLVHAENGNEIVASLLHHWLHNEHYKREQEPVVASSCF